VKKERVEGAAQGVAVAARVEPPVEARVAETEGDGPASFLSKLLPDIGALAYAPSQGGTVENPGRQNGDAKSMVTEGVAVYDISAHLVYVPGGGEPLEAHSGLGAFFDDPSHVNEIMRGATPPGVFDLTMREQPFHRVAALRLNPISGNMHKRVGLLAHTCMLGEACESNGCVSFREYGKFLKLFREGRVRRLIVVEGRKPGLLRKWFARGA
jgi:hypothetical protein